MISQQVKKLDIPELPGVYVFRDYQKRPLYIGRATSLKDRTKSYFSNDLIETRGPRIVDMVTKAKTLTWETTDSVLEAIILESALIKKYQPHYNVDERDDKSSYYVVITKEEWPRVFLARARDFDAQRTKGELLYKVKAVFGPYVHSGLIKEALKILRKMFPFKDNKSHDPRHDAFYQAIGRSPRSVSQNDQVTITNDQRRYQRTIANLILFFEGKKKLLQAKLTREMNTHAKKLEFEEAQKAKRLIYALDHVNDMALIKQDQNTMKPAGGGQESRPFRMEAYDIAHLSGTNVVGAFTVSVNGEFVPAEYRKFKISRQVNNDVAGLIEILSRRLNHTEWTYPDLIIVDGGEAQLNAAQGVLKARRISIPVVGVTKDEYHKASELIGNGELAEKYKTEIIRLNAEVHRFAIAFHKQKRKASFIT
ncbi:MAG: GIY-YIG nuclease family protein [Candidatus Pacebacteria bacterium]|nr:GIY-YIG nuclease family protein [Candidatus Paceibacterota bacterium]